MRCLPLSAMRPPPEEHTEPAGSIDHRQAPVCILGMHRSGTSVTARMLNLLGLDLGSEHTMLEPLDHDNPRGFWEQRGIMELNDELLARLGGFWWRLPELTPERLESEDLEPLRERARALLHGRASSRRTWGFKDPRVSVTLPFWSALRPELRYVICVRSPLAVAASLETRDAKLHDRRASMDLWVAYTARALLGTTGRPRLVVFYEDYLHDVSQQVDRLADFLHCGSAVPGADRAAAGRAFEGELGHHQASISQMLVSSDVTAGAAALFATLRMAHGERAGRGPIVPDDAVEALAGKLLAERTGATGRPGGAARRDRAVEQERDRRSLRELAAAKRRVAALEQEVASLRHIARRSGDEIRRAESFERERASLRRKLQHRDRELAAIRGSLGWRLTRPLRMARSVLRGDK